MILLQPGDEPGPDVGTNSVSKARGLRAPPAPRLSKKGSNKGERPERPAVAPFDDSSPLRIGQRQRNMESGSGCD